MNRFQLKISLKDSKPLIWRRVIVDANLLLEDLHQVIQIVMPWTNSHLHQFMKGEMIFSIPEEDDENSPWGDFLGGFETVDSTNMSISDVLLGEKDKMIYEYDFGDSWRHAVVVEKILPPSDKGIRTEYVTGKNACPPEDCGGIYGYMDLLQRLSNPKSEDYKWSREWMGLKRGETLDIKELGFNPDDINKKLSEL